MSVTQFGTAATSTSIRAEGALFSLGPITPDRSGDVVDPGAAGLAAPAAVRNPTDNDSAPEPNPRSGNPAVRAAAQKNRAVAYGRRWVVQSILKGIEKVDDDGNVVLRPTWVGFDPATGEVPMVPEEKYDRHLGCGRRRITADPWITVRGDGERAWYEGILTCSLFWLCPACTMGIRRERAQQIETAAHRWLAGWDPARLDKPFRNKKVKTGSDGFQFCDWKPPLRMQPSAASLLNVPARPAGSLAFVTLTVPHSKTMPLADTFGFIMKASRDMFQGRAGVALREDCGLAYRIRATEITWGDRHGFHPHVHFLLFLDGKATPERLEEIRSHLYESWAKQVSKAGFRSIRTPAGLKHSVRVDPVTKGKGLAEYLAKVSDEYGKASKLGMEMSRSDLKRGRKVQGPSGGRSYKTHSINEIIDMIGEHRAGVPCSKCAGRDPKCSRYLKAVAVFREYAEETAGRRAIQWSPGLKALLGIEEVPEEDAASESPADGSAALLLLGCLDDDDWAAVLRFKAQADVLQAAEEGGIEGLREAVESLRARAEK